MHGHVGRVRLPTTARRRSGRSGRGSRAAGRSGRPWSAAWGSSGSNQGSMMIVWPPGVVTSKHEWPNHVNVVSAIESHAYLLPASVILADAAHAPRLHSPRARHADRREPRVHQLDGPDRPRARVVRGGRPGRLRTEATRGFLAFTAACARCFGVLALALATGPCPRPSAARRSSTTRPCDAPRGSPSAPSASLVGAYHRSAGSRRGAAPSTLGRRRPRRRGARLRRAGLGRRRVRRGAAARSSSASWRPRPAASSRR